MDPDHHRVPEGAWLGGRGLRSLPRTHLRPGLGMVARSTGRSGGAAGSTKRAVRGGFDTLAIERRRASRAARRRLAGRRTDGLLATRSGRLRPDMGHLRADYGEPRTPL